MTDNNNARYVYNELLEIISSAMEAGFVEFVGFAVRDGSLTAEVYDTSGNIVGEWAVSITVTEAVPE